MLYWIPEFRGRREGAVLKRDRSAHSCSHTPRSHEVASSWGVSNIGSAVEGIKGVSSFAGITEASMFLKMRMPDRGEFS